ncbi:MAG: DNA primase [Ruminococcaceae bacterium]|nr:DNA primase [Oscillospiraceae bacterium]
MALPDSFIQELIARNDVESVISAYVPLRRRGRNLVGLCPFHGEKTASFTVYPETASFYCFGCHVGGDVITFIKQIESLEYMDAVRFLADRSGMKMPENSRENEQTSRMRVRILEINREAARLFHQVLYQPEGKIALDYYHSRGYTDSTIRRFGLGYAPDSWDFLIKALRQKGYYPEELKEAFLAAKGRNGGYYDVYRNRVIIPIIDVRGAVVGFGGRVLDDAKPKYINTENTLVYNKRRNLFALNFAKNTGKELNICEGYMDAIAMHQAGFTNTVAALGTAFPEEQVQLIARYADRVNLIFDADLAGREATQRAIANLRKTGLDVRVVSIPDGKDPDEYIKRNGPEAFRRLLEGSANAVEYRLLEIGKNYDIRSSNGKILYFKEAAKVLAELDSPVERDVYAGRLSELLGISKEAILQEVEGNRRGKQRAAAKQQLQTLVRQESKELRQVNADAAAHPRAANAEESLLGTLILHPDYFKQIKPILSPEQMVTAFNRELYTRLLERYQQGLMLELSFLSVDYDEAQMAYITRMVRDAKERVLTPEDAVTFATIIRDEHALKGLADPANATDEELLKMMETLRARKKK